MKSNELNGSKAICKYIFTSNPIVFSELNNRAKLVPDPFSDLLCQKKQSLTYKAWSHSKIKSLELAITLLLIKQVFYRFLKE